MILLDLLKESNNDKIEKTVNLNLLAASIIYIYAKRHKLNGKGGITASKLSNFFNIKPASITQLC